MAKAADIVLDSMMWSGNNSSMEASACDRPIVTLPGTMMRARHSYAINTHMGITETIADDVDHYIDIAVRLGTDPAFHAQQVEAIRANKEKLYDDPAPIEAFAQFLLQCG